MISKRLFFAAITSYLVYLFVAAPAQLLGGLLGQLTGNHIELAASQGTIWKGSANVLLNPSDANDPPVGLGKATWLIQPLQLFSGRLPINLTLNDGSPFWITLDSSRIHIEHAAFNIPAEVVPALSPSLKAARLGGQLAIRCENFSLTRADILGELEIDWSEASSPLSMVSPLGNYHSRLEGKGRSLQIRVDSVGDTPLILQGTGHWDSIDGLHFAGTAEANPAFKSQLQELLRVMGNETSPGSGKYQLRL